MPQIQIYNSLSRRKEHIPQAKKLRLFVCGPTTYDDIHIGHARTYIFFDFFAKYLRSRGLKLQYVQNITNVDDKIIGRAWQEKKEPLKFADYFTKRYLADMKALGIRSVNAYAPATKFVSQIVKQVQTLIKKGYAYKISGDGWYYDISKFKDYGKLSGRTAEQAEDAVSRIDESIKKRNRGDFCLWKFVHANSAPSLTGSGPLRHSSSEASNAKAPMRIINGEPAWQSPLGLGRPGWHIEDTAISEYYFGPQYEIHGGGLDLKFPHHEAEIAQQEAASGKKPFVKIWVHAGMLTVEGKKMSKSLGNFITVQDFLKKHRPEALRLAFFGTHYRSPFDYSKRIINDAEASIARLGEFLGKLAFARKTKAGQKVFGVEGFIRKFNTALEDDINIPGALAEVFAAIGEANHLIWQIEQKSATELEKFIKSALKILRLRVPMPKIPAKIKVLTKQREKFRTNKQFMQSDALRKKVDALGYLIEDTPAGPFIWPKQKRVS